MTRREFVKGGLALGGAVASLPRGAAAASPVAAASAANAQAPGSARTAARPAQLLVFDTFGTVVDWRTSVIAEGEKLGKAKGLSVDWAAFADAWRGGYSPSLERVRKGEMPWTPLDVIHRRLLDELLVRFEVTGLTEEEIAHFNRVWHRLKPWPDAVAGLTRLRRRYTIAPLSNGNVALLTNMAKNAGIPWDCILSTELVRHYKPDPETYLMPGQLFDLSNDQVMMVAAHAGDLQAAKALGLKTAYVHRQLEYGPARKITPPAAGRFDYLASDFKDLARQLDA
jgi:2-haloacid dehalogenase